MSKRTVRLVVAWILTIAAAFWVALLFGFASSLLT